MIILITYRNSPMVVHNSIPAVLFGQSRFSLLSSSLPNVPTSAGISKSPIDPQTCHSFIWKGRTLSYLWMRMDEVGRSRSACTKVIDSKLVEFQAPVSKWERIFPQSWLIFYMRKYLSCRWYQFTLKSRYPNFPTKLMIFMAC